MVKIVFLLNKFYFIISLFCQGWARLGLVVVVRLDKAWQAWLSCKFFYQNALHCLKICFTTHPCQGNQFKDQKITASNGNSWIVSGYWDFEISQIRLFRIEGSITDDGIGDDAMG